MKKKIGIPRIGYYYKKGVFLKNFINYLGHKTVLSKETNIEIINNGNNNLSYDNCFFNKIYLGHILNIAKSCDFVIIYTECSHYKKCIKNQILIETIKKHIISNQILIFNTSNIFFVETMKLALKLTKNPIKIIYSYLRSLKKQKNHSINKENLERNKINNQYNKILITGSHNNINNKYFIAKIINYLSKENITPLFSNNLNKKDLEPFIFKDKNKVFSQESKEIIGATNYYQYCIKGIIYLSTENCETDEYLYNCLKEKITKLPILNIPLNEHMNQEKIETELEILIDDIKRNSIF